MMEANILHRFNSQICKITDRRQGSVYSVYTSLFHSISELRWSLRIMGLLFTITWGHCINSVAATKSNVFKWERKLLAWIILITLGTSSILHGLLSLTFYPLLYYSKTRGSLGEKTDQSDAKFMDGERHTLTGEAWWL